MKNDMKEKYKLLLSEETKSAGFKIAFFLLIALIFTIVGQLIVSYSKGGW